MPFKDPEERKRRQRGYSAKFYSNNKALSQRRTKDSSRVQKRKWEAFKASLSCTVCGFKHPAVIDFHHVDPSTKTAAVHAFIQDVRFAAAYEEVKKCVALCANCHRIHHYNEHQATKTARRKAKKKKGPDGGP